MKQNKYDNPVFFDKYSKLQRSAKGLQAAGEWHALQKLLPDFTNKRVLDIGCGYGWHCIYAAEHGAEYVLGIDISAKMVAVAKEKTKYKNVDYMVLPMEDMDFTDNSFDIVISSLSFHYTKDFFKICKLINRILSPNGSFVFSVEHPVFTSHFTQDWIYDSDSNPLHWPIDDYFSETKRVTHFLGEQVVKYHRTLTTYLNNLLQSNFTIVDVVEPQPDPSLLAIDASMQLELRRPMMLIVSAKSNKI